MATRITRGDPGREKMAALQEMLRLGVQPRRIFAGERARVVRLESETVDGNLGAAWPPRGVAIDAEGPAIPPYLLDRSLVEAGAGGPGTIVLAPGAKKKAVPKFIGHQYSGIDYSVGGGLPVSLSVEVGINEVDGAMSRRLQGPLVVRGWQVTMQGAETTSAQWNLWRCDFSEFGQLQTFTFGDNGLPTGGAKDGLSLYWEGAIFDDTTLGGQIDPQGWSRNIGPLASSGPTGFLSSHLIVPFGGVFVKFYVQNDSAGARIQTLFLDCARLVM